MSIESNTATVGGHVDMSAERAALVRPEQEMDRLRQVHPGWYAAYDEAMIDTADRAVYVELLNTAPTPFAVGLLYGKFAMRMEIEQITGRAFA